MNKIKKIIVSIAVVLSITFLFATENKKDQLTIHIDQVVSKDYPEMTAFAVIKNQKGELVSGLSPSLFSFRIDTQNIKAKSKVVPFSMADEKVDYFIMVSNNGIMEGEPLDFQKNAILKFVEVMNDNDTLSVYTVGEDASCVCENVTKKTFDSAIINKLDISNNQPRLYDSIINLVRKVEQKNYGHKVIIILSDGRDQNSRFTKDQLNETLNNSGIPVYTVGMKILSNQTLSNLDEISELTGGFYYYSPNLSYLPNNLKKIIDCVKQCYVIKLKVKNVRADNQAHILEVKVTERDSEGKGLKTFIAVKHPIPKWLQIVFLVVGILLIVVVIILFLLRKMMKRKSMGITRRKCPDCGNIMKDSWESCPFCKYMPEVKKKKKKDKK